MTMSRWIIYTICLLLPGLVLRGQYRFDNYKHLTTENGLPSNYVYDVAEDQYGFIWIATTSGLARYDGSKISTLTKIDTDSTHLADHYISALLAIRDSLWIGTRSGLSVLNLKTGRIANHFFSPDHLQLQKDGLGVSQKSVVWSIAEDRQGNIWLTPTNNGFIKWDKHTQTFTRFPLFEDQELPSAYTQSDQASLKQIIQDVEQDSIMWAASMAGLVRLNTTNGKYQRILYRQGSEETQFSINRKISIHQDKNGKIYSGSWYGGLSIYDPSTGHYDHPSLDFPDHTATYLTEEHLYNITSGDPGSLYLSFGRGLYLYDIATDGLQLIKNSVYKGDHEIRFGIKFIDSSNRVWYPSGGGIVIGDPMVQQYRWFSLADLNPTRLEVLPRAMVEDFYPGYLSISGQYTDGIYHVNPTTGHKFKTTFKEHMLHHEFFDAWGMNELNDSTLLVSELNTLYTLKKGSDQFIPYDVQVPLQYHFQTQSLIDDYGILWQGSRKDGLFYIDLNREEINAYRPENSSAFVGTPFQDSKGNVWMLSSFGHLAFSRKEGHLFDFNNNRDSLTTLLEARNFCECPNGELWLASYREGLGLLDSDHPERGVIKKIRVANRHGHPINIIALACNENNELWAIGSGGLTKINREDWSSFGFSVAYGLKKFSGMFQFLKNGELFIASRDGFYLTNPDDVVINTQMPRPYVISVTSQEGPKNRLEDHLHQIPVDLTANENVITIEFSAINHTLAERTRFLYKMEGIDEDWIDPGNKRALTYSYLPGGDYVFKLKAGNNENLWNEAVYELPIHIGTPWYKTVLFWVIVAFLIIGMVISIYQFRIEQIQKANLLKSTFEKRVAGLEMSALRAQMNPHFIFNCLNSIESYIIRNDTRKASQYLNNFGRLVRLILQNSRSSYISLEDELESLNLYLELEQMRFKDSFAYEIILQEGLHPEAMEIPPMLLQPFLENAIWHGLNHREAGGIVTVNIKKCEESLVCVIQDNGIGRVAAGKLRAAQKIKRKSMGMDITLQRIETINKIYNTNNEVTIEDLYDEQGNPTGTRITIVIPL